MIKPITLAVQTLPYDGPRLTRLTVEFITLPPTIEAELAQQVYALIDRAVYEYQQRDAGLTELARLSQEMGPLD